MKAYNSCNPVFYRVEGGSGWSPDLVGSGLDVSGSGLLETPQHFTALQGLKLLLNQMTSFCGVKFHMLFFCEPLLMCKCLLQVPDGATVTLVSRQSKQIHHDSHDYIPGESEFPCLSAQCGV